MKTFTGALALIIAAPVAAQNGPATDAQPGHAHHGTMEHSQHDQGKHDCKKCCEEMKGKDGKMECMRHGEAQSPAPGEPEHHAHSH